MTLLVNSDLRIDEEERAALEEWTQNRCLIEHGEIQLDVYSLSSLV